MTSINSNNSVVFFDGVCGLCNGFVDFVMKHDSKKIFYFSPLQSDFAKNSLPPEYTSDLKTMVVMIDGKIFKKSEAVFKVLQGLGGIWAILTIFRILPAAFLNIGYDAVATNRYNLFGKKETCRLPSPDERQRFVL